MSRSELGIVKYASTCKETYRTCVQCASGGLCGPSWHTKLLVVFSIMGNGVPEWLMSDDHTRLADGV